MADGMHLNGPHRRRARKLLNLSDLDPILLSSHSLELSTSVYLLAVWQGLDATEAMEAESTEEPCSSSTIHPFKDRSQQCSLGSWALAPYWLPSHGRSGGGEHFVSLCHI